MMTILWLIFIVMVVVICAAIVYVLRDNAPSLILTQQKTNKAWYQQRIDELNKQHQEGTLIAMQYEQEKLALQKDFSGMAAVESTLQFNQYTMLAVLIVFFVVIGSAVLYKKLGASESLSKFYQQKVLDDKAQAAMKKMGSVDQVIAQMQARLAAHPDDAQGWYLLGRIYFTQNHFDQAADAFLHAQKLAPNRADIAIQLAEASYLSSNKSMQKLAHARLQAALKLAPDDPAALNLEAIMAYHDKAYQKALSIWQQLAIQAPAGSAAAQALQQAIQDARQKMRQLGIKDNVATVTLPISVRLDRALAEKVSSNAILFVYAKAVNGPPMPIAIKRMPIADFPIKTQLTNNDGIMPTFKLSDAKDVVVYARISKSGQAVPQAGDLEGESTIVDMKQVPAQVIVTINHVD